jgi:hypothetical protein
VKILEQENFSKTLGQEKFSGIIVTEIICTVLHIENVLGLLDARWHSRFMRALELEMSNLEGLLIQISFIKRK